MISGAAAQGSEVTFCELSERLARLEQLRSDPKSYWAEAKDVAEAIRSASLLPHDRRRLWGRFHALREEMQRGREEWKARQEENAKTLADAIANLHRESHTDLLGDGHPTDDYRGLAEQVSELFKTLKPVAVPDRARLWSEFNKIRDAVRCNRERFANHSAQKRDLVLTMIREAGMAAKCAEDRNELIEADRMLGEIQEWMKDGWNAATGTDQFFNSIAGDEGRLLSKDRAACWATYKEARECLKNRRLALQEAGFGEAKELAGKVWEEVRASNPFDAIKAFKGAQQAAWKLYMGKEHRERILGHFNEIFAAIQDRFAEYNAERERKKREWVERQESGKARLEGALQSKRDYRSRVEGQIDDLQEKLNGARTEEFADLVRGWIEERYEKIRTVTQEIEELERIVEDIEERLRGA